MYVEHNVGLFIGVKATIVVAINELQVAHFEVLHIIVGSSRCFVMWIVVSAKLHIVVAASFCGW